jgi:Reverse transcriptase (RNA-dependent DNA polymerase)
LVYKIKYHSDGIVERYKARLVAKRYTQTHVIDYHETFTPVVKMNTVRILLSTAVNNNWNLHQIDNKNAFLQGTLEEEVYMVLPPGHKKKDISNFVYKLKKLIYGLKKSPRVWYEKLSHFLILCNFKVSSAESSLFIKHNATGTTVVLVYVDDIIIIGNNKIKIECVKKDLKQKSEIKDFGKLKYFFGIEIAHSHKGLFMSQRKYALDLLKETGKLGCKPTKTPIKTNIKLSTESGEPLKNINHFQKLIEKLIYVTVTRPNYHLP